MTLAATLLRRPGVAQRLFGNLQVDVAAARERLHWQPPVAVAEAMRQTVNTGEVA